MFEDTISLFDDLYQRLDRDNAPGFIRDLGCEVRERLQQLDYVIARVRAAGAAAAAAFARSSQALVDHVEWVKSEGLDYQSVSAPDSTKVTPEEFRAHEAASFEMKLLAEAFYYFAGRVRSILRHKSQPLPGLASFECEGVRNVRNKLLEHPEGADSQVFIQSWAWSAPRGPVLKAARYGGQESLFPDLGLYANAEEFRTNLNQILRRALESRGA